MSDSYHIRSKDLVINKPLPAFSINNRQDAYIRMHKHYNEHPLRYKADVEMLSRLLGVQEGMKILEIGGGVGYSALELANQKAEVIDLDICPGNAYFVDNIADFYKLNVRGVMGDTCALPFRDEYFDAVFSKDIFEHIWDVDCAINEQTRVLITGGKLCILVGNLGNPKTFFNLFIKRFINSKGREGGLKWLFRKHTVYSNYGIGWKGKDEDIVTYWWWKKKFKSYPRLQLVELTTSRAYKNPNSYIYNLLKPFAGSIVLLAEKVD